MRISVIIPTKDAENSLYKLLLSIKSQSLNPAEIIIVDSSSKDNTVEIACKLGANVIKIKEEEFDHGRARNLGASNATGDILVFMTQDVICESEKTFENLIKSLKDVHIAASYARQIPKKGSNPVEQYLRLFNYPPYRIEKKIKDVLYFGAKAFFFSNVCSAVKKDVFEEIGGFTEGVIMNEDMLFAINLLKKGYRIVYEPEAKVYHSHNYSLKSVFSRYFDIGVFMSQNGWLRKIAKTEKQGISYFLGLMKFLIKNKKKIWIPYAIVDTCARFAGYKIGIMEKYIPLGIKKKISLNKNFWK